MTRYVLLHSAEVLEKPPSAEEVVAYFRSPSPRASALFIADRRWASRQLGAHDIYTKVAENPKHAVPRNARKNSGRRS